MVFDTTPCISGPYIGDVNKVTAGAATDFYLQREDGSYSYQSGINGWWNVKDEQSYVETWAAPGVPTGNYEASKSTDLRIDGTWGWSDKSIYVNQLEAWVEMREDCDKDCQARGSQLSIVGVLMGTVYSLVALNALFMFIGAWRYRWRACSLYCTMFTCLFHLFVTIACGALLMTKYNAVCSLSMYWTNETMRWTMRDDFAVTTTLWGGSFVTCFIFLCCGMCSAYKEHK